MQLRYKLPVNCSRTFSLNSSPLSRKPPNSLSSVTTNHTKFCRTQQAAQESCFPILQISTPLQFSASPLPPPFHCYWSGSMHVPSQEWIYGSFCRNCTKMLGSMPRRLGHIPFLTSVWKQSGCGGCKNVVIPTRGSKTLVGTPGRS